MERTITETRAEQLGMKVNPNAAHVVKIEDKLKANKGYCPCLPKKGPDTLCPCRYAREMKTCRCGLYMA